MSHCTFPMNSFWKHILVSSQADACPGWTNAKIYSLEGNRFPICLYIHKQQKQEVRKEILIMAAGDSFPALNCYGFPQLSLTNRHFFYNKKHPFK